ncbi:MAG: YjbQ family protein, partial [Planctomycetes bacterium]|nr:YjbQ family protein [Planctomycetota bacterium]MBU4399461.1 YjbQ family protein [Planctomycetota bacterium]MCG2683101.1 YjbQ family protein [Planctomycetales bacterium]
PPCHNSAASCTLFSWRFLLFWLKVVRATPPGPEEPPFSISTTQGTTSEPGLHDDYKRWLEKLAPHDPSPKTYHHNRTGEDNGDAHHKRQIMGREVVVAVTGGKLDFGPWEQIFYGEFDGRRPKRVLVKVIGE